MASRKQRASASSAAAVLPPDGADEITEPGQAAAARAQAPLAAGVADAAAARLLVFDELPAEERPRDDDRVLLVGLVWGGSTLVELEQLGRGADLPVRRLFDLPALKLAANFPIVKHAGDGHVLTLPDGVEAEIHAGGQVSPLSRKGRRVEAPFSGYAAPIGSDDRVVARLGPQLTLIARYVRAARQKDKPLLEQIDIPFATTLAAALLVLGLFFLLVGLAPRNDETWGNDLERQQQIFTRYQVKPRPPPPPEQPKVKDLAGVKEGEKAKGPEGKVGTDTAKQKEAAPSKKGTAQVDPNKKDADLKKIKKLGLIAALSKMGVGGGAASAVLGPGGFGSGINTSLGGTRSRAAAGDQLGVGGTGSRGTGTGGGGKALGIGGLGTKGSGAGRGGYGEVDLGGRGKDDTVFVPGHTTVVGGLSREVINRVIQKHYNEIKYCYEKELTHDPGLYGKVTVLFVIDGSGHVADALVQQTTMSSEPVESCMVNHVRRWVFPSPQGGGTVQVTYPYVFKSSGQ